MTLQDSLKQIRDSLEYNKTNGFTFIEHGAVEKLLEVVTVLSEALKEYASPPWQTCTSREAKEALEQAATILGEK